MILFALRCSADHEFEAWFRDNKAFDTQKAAGKIACPECGDRAVEKAVMAPRLKRSQKSDRMPTPQQVMGALRELRRQVEKNCDYVGEKFAEEARRIHYGEVDPHNIYGETSPEEAETLADEGIEVSRIPWVQTSDA
jgi:hypothetical protein